MLWSQTCYVSIRHVMPHSWLKIKRNIDRTQRLSFTWPAAWAPWSIKQFGAKVIHSLDQSAGLVAWSCHLGSKNDLTGQIGAREHSDPRGLMATALIKSFISNRRTVKGSHTAQVIGNRCDGFSLRLRHVVSKRGTFELIQCFSKALQYIIWTILRTEQDGVIDGRGGGGMGRILKYQNTLLLGNISCL